MIRKLSVILGLICCCASLQGCATIVVSYDGGDGYHTSLRIMHYPPIQNQVR